MTIKNSFTLKLLKILNSNKSQKMFHLLPSFRLICKGRSAKHRGDTQSINMELITKKYLFKV